MIDTFTVFLNGMVLVMIYTVIFLPLLGMGFKFIRMIFKPLLWE